MSTLKIKMAQRGNQKILRMWRDGMEVRTERNPDDWDVIARELTTAPVQTNGWTVVTQEFNGGQDE